LGSLSTTTELGSGWERGLNMSGEFVRVDKADQLAWELKHANPLLSGFVCEFKFHPKRQWRLDIAYVEQKLAIEVDGGLWTRGRHVRGAGVLEDNCKFAELAILGWRLIRVAPSQIKSGEALQWIERALGLWNTEGKGEGLSESRSSTRNCTAGS
jgi:very-short-patch-repair endonuclease